MKGFMINKETYYPSIMYDMPNVICFFLYLSFNAISTFGKILTLNKKVNLALT